MDNVSSHNLSIRVYARLKSTQILQHITLWALLFYTAARPGSLIATDNYLDSFLRFEVRHHSPVLTPRCVYPSRI